jgi:hypothetical protein
MLDLKLGLSLAINLTANALLGERSQVFIFSKYVVMNQIMKVGENANEQ